MEAASRKISVRYPPAREQEHAPSWRLSTAAEIAVRSAQRE
jgi:hypothetical protein